MNKDFIENYLYSKVRSRISIARDFLVAREKHFGYTVPVRSLKLSKVWLC